MTTIGVIIFIILVGVALNHLEKRIYNRIIDLENRVDDLENLHNR